MLTSKQVVVGLFYLVIGLSANSLLGQQQKLEDQIRFSAEFQIEKGTDQGVILLTAEIVKGNYIYALKQPGKVISPSKITVAKSDSFSVEGFLPDSDPILVKNDPVFRADIAKHKGKIVFWAPIKLVKGQLPKDLKIEVSFNGSVCTAQGMCFPIRDKPIRVRFGGYYDRKAQKNK